MFTECSFTVVLCHIIQLDRLLVVNALFHHFAGILLIVLYRFYIYLRTAVRQFIRYVICLLMMSSSVSSRRWQVSEVLLEYLCAWSGGRKLASIWWSGARHIWIVHRCRNWRWYGWYSGLVMGHFRCFSLDLWVYIIIPRWWPMLRSWWVLVDRRVMLIIDFCHTIDASSVARSGCKIEDIIWDGCCSRSLVHIFRILRHRIRIWMCK